jgi:hypothetical protein
MSEDNSANNTNTLVLVAIVCGLYYVLNRNQDVDLADYGPALLAAFLVFTLKTQIQETLSMDRLYTLLAIGASTYVLSIDGTALQAAGTAAGFLVLLPAIQAPRST